jgi:uncharacterized membrane protein
MTKSLKLTAFAIILYANNICAQLKFRNSKSTPIYIAIAYGVQSTDYTGYNSDGWFKVEPNSTITLFSQINQPVYYFYAKDGSGNEWARQI